MRTVPLLSPELRNQLRANWAMAGEDHVPVAKLFNPIGLDTWLATELGDDEDTLFGLADLGVGWPEVGTFSLTELEEIKLPYGLHVEHDRSFRTDHTLSVWEAAATVAGSINGAQRILSKTRGAPQGHEQT